MNRAVDASPDDPGGLEEQLRRERALGDFALSVPGASSEVEIVQLALTLIDALVPLGSAIAVMHAEAGLRVVVVQTPDGELLVAEPDQPDLVQAIEATSLDRDVAVLSHPTNVPLSRWLDRNHPAPTRGPEWSPPAVLVLRLAQGLGTAPDVLVCRSEPTSPRRAAATERDLPVLERAVRHIEAALTSVRARHDLERQVDLRTGELGRANDTLRASLEELRRAQAELTRRGHDMRLVLDNVAQGLLTVDMRGYLARERSAMVDRWFGAGHGDSRDHDGDGGGEIAFAAFARRIDPEFADNFEVAYEAYVEGALPQDLCLEQLPTQFSFQRRTYRCSYSQLEERGEQRGLLIVISDVSEQLAQESKAAEQSEMMALVQGFLRDRSGCVAFFDEGARLVEELWRARADRPTAQRLLHTLKGTAACADLRVLAQLCHRAEDEIEEAHGQIAALEGSLGRVRDRWQSLNQALLALLGGRKSSVVQVDMGEAARLREMIRNGAQAATVLQVLSYACLEEAELALARLAKYARELALRLGKGEIAVEVQARGVRVDPARWSPLWSDLVHLVRNAVDHGLEAPDEREQAGKAATPTLRLGVAVADGQLLVEIADDGRGIAWDEVRALAARRGLPCEADGDLVVALFSGSFSTRRHVTLHSGRGLGLAAVASRVRQMDGTIAVASERRHGTRWTLAFAASPPSWPDSAMAPSPDVTPER